MKTVLFEDEKYHQLLPLVYFRPVWELRCGAYLLCEKMKDHVAEGVALLREGIGKNRETPAVDQIHFVDIFMGKPPLLNFSPDRFM